MTHPNPPLQPGLEATIERVVLPEWTLTHYDPNLPPVFSTPAMIGLMEMAGSIALMPALPPHTISVGTRIEVDHLRAIFVGATVKVHAKLSEINGRFLTFEVEARHGTEVIGRGRVFRAMVDRARFSEKASRRNSS